MFKILIIDDDPILRTVLKRALENQGYNTTVASNGEEGIIQAQRLRPGLIICDWVMSHMDGLEVCRRIKADPELASTFFILLTAKGAAPGEEGDRIQGLDTGADEFVSKPIDLNELKARVRAGLRIHQLHEDLQLQKQSLQELNQNLHNQKEIIEAELAEAADYVRSLLPPPLEKPVNIETLFVPSAQLGGDCFDYYWIDDDNLAIYLLDVSGHGVGSALLSVSVLNILRSQSLPNTNFSQPSQVLKALNNSFQMSNHHEKYFTIWYGVYNRIQRQLVYANAGHPPALLLSTTDTNSIQIKQLDSLDLPIGFLPDMNFDVAVLNIEKNSTLYVFSDGAYEISQLNGEIWGLDALFDLLKNSDQTNPDNLKNILNEIMTSTKHNSFDDDLSLLQIKFG